MMGQGHALTPIDQTQAEQDANSQRNQAKLAELIAKVKQGYRPQGQELALITAYKHYDPTLNKISDYSWWHTWGPIVMEAAGFAAGGALAGTGALAGVGGTNAGLVPGLVDMAAANAPFAAVAPAVMTAFVNGNQGQPQSQPDPATPPSDQPPLPSHNPMPSQPSNGVPTTGPSPGIAPPPGGGMPPWVEPVAKTLPGLLPLVMNHGNGANASGNGLDPTQSSQLNELMQLLIDRAKRAAPVHQLAMDTATRMAPSGVASPMMQQGLQASMAPRQTAQTDPQVLDAIHRLMMGGH